MGDKRKNFGPLSIAALAFNTNQAWAGIGAALALGIGHGGSPTLIYGLVLVSIAYVGVALSAGELAAQYPTAGGQYHWAAIIAPRRFRIQLGYTCGCINLLGWITGISGMVAIPSQIVVGIIKLYSPNKYQIRPWHTFLVYQATNLFAYLYNLFFLRKAAWTHNLGFLISVTALFVVTIVCLVMAPSKQSSHSVWAEFLNQTGWSSGVAFATGLINVNFGYAGMDSALHLAEECINPTMAVPWALISAVFMNLTTTLVFFVAIFYCTSDMNAVINTPTQIPLYEIFLQATGRTDGVATLFVTVIALLIVITAISAHQTASRLTWSFARDNALLGSKYLKRIHPVFQVPVYALTFNFVAVFALGCIYLGSATAFNAIVSPCIILEQFTFAIPAALMMLRGRVPSLTPAKTRFNLGAFGWIANAVTIAWLCVEIVFYNLPPVLPVTEANMNYSVVVLAAEFLFVGANWMLHGKKYFKGPKVDFQGLRAESAEDLSISERK